MKKLMKTIFFALCAAFLFTACKQVLPETPQTPASQTQTEQTPPQTEEETDDKTDETDDGENATDGEITEDTEETETTEDSPAVETPPAQDEDNGDDGKDEGEENGETPEPDDEPSEPQENTYEVRFYTPDGGLLGTVERKEGETLSETDIPAYQPPKGERYVWTIPNEPLTADVELYAELYLEISTAAEFLSIAGDGKYILTQDIDLSSVDTEDYAVDGDTGGLIPSFGGMLDGGGHALSGLTFTGSSAKCLIGVLSGGTVKDLDFGEVRFEGVQTPMGGRKAYGCALIGALTDGARLSGCKADITYTASGQCEDLERSDAGLVRLLENGGFFACELSLQTPNGSSSDGIYAVCVWKREDMTTEGVTIKGNGTFAEFAFSSESAEK